ncbi:MFS transporter [Streptomyces sp. NPDC057654]|uniref:MFS transporter n=1 Tax=Streptomyces sp. NPDC057654 TaxID=3346196 RepID=UPI0036A39260
MTPPAAPALRRTRHFTALLAASGVSAVGDGVRLAAFPLLVITLTDNPVAVTGVAIANRLPWLLVSLVSGAVADRYDRRTLMILVDLCRAAVVSALAIAVLTHADPLTLLYGVALLLGIGETLFSTAAQGLLPDLVKAEQLPHANGRLFTLQNVGSNFIGPMAGSWLFSLGKAVPFIIDAISFVIGSSLLSLVPSTNRPSTTSSSTSLRKDVTAGIQLVRHHPLLRSFLLVITVVNLTQSAAQSLLALLAVDELGLPPSQFGLILAGSGVGAFLGGMLSPRIGDRLGVPAILLPAVAVTCPLFALMSWTDQPAVLGLALTVNAFFGLMANVQMTSLRQQLVPREYLSRVASVNMLCAFGFAIPAGALGAGLLAEHTTIRTVYLGCALLILLLVLAITPTMRPAFLRRTISALHSADERSPAP